jgi:hypothetical protein
LPFYPEIVLGIFFNLSTIQLTVCDMSVDNVEHAVKNKIYPN